MRTSAKLTDLVLRESPTFTAVTDRMDRLGHYGCQAGPAGTIALKDMEGYPLRRFWPDTWQAAQAIDQLGE